MREARLPQKRRAGQGCSLQEILALELVIRGPAGGELCRVHMETLFVEACGDPDVRDLKDYLRERLGVPVDCSACWLAPASFMTASCYNR